MKIEDIKTLNDILAYKEQSNKEIKHLDEELKKKSVFYNEKLIDDNYLKNRN